MNDHAISAKPIGMVLAALLCAAGMWMFAQRVLIPHQVRDDAAHGRPRGNLSDLYPRWVGARELLLHGRDPYSAEVTREIQLGYYGRLLDHARPDDPRDEEAFAYPVYVVFGLAPTVRLPFPIVQKSYFWLMVALTVAGVLVWLRALALSAPPATQATILILTLGSLPVMQGLKLEQISLVVAALLAIGILLLIKNRPIAAGIVLALTTIKPQLVLLLLLWLGIWTLADWRRRYHWLAAFLVTMAILFAASEYYLPHWIPRFWQALHEYQRYTGAMGVMEKLLRPTWGRPVEIVAFAALAKACWGEWRNAANTRAFIFAIALVLAVTVLVIPTSAVYNQVLLIPALLVLVQERRTIWQGNLVGRLLFLIVVAMVLWPWIASVILAGLSFVLPRETVERGWPLPFWTTLFIPLGVAAMMLVLAGKRTFAASAEVGTS